MKKKNIIHQDSLTLINKIFEEQEIILKQILEPLRSMENARKMITDSLIKPFEKIAESQKIIEDIHKSIQIPKINISSELFKTIESFGKSFGDMDIYPGNWEKKDFLKEAIELSKSGIPIIGLPRKTIIEEIINEKNESRKYQVLIKNKKEILEDCKILISKIGKSNDFYADIIEHLNEGIEAFESQKYRISQSAMAVVIEALATHFINDRNKKGKIKKISKRIPENQDEYLIKILIAYPIIFLIEKIFEGEANFYENGDFVDKNIIGTNFNRHSSAHTVHRKQYNELNALLGIMAALSLLYAFSNLGVDWENNL